MYQTEFIHTAFSYRSMTSDIPIPTPQKRYLKNIVYNRFPMCREGKKKFKKSFDIVSPCQRSFEF